MSCKTQFFYETAIIHMQSPTCGSRARYLVLAKVLEIFSTVPTTSSALRVRILYATNICQHALSQQLLKL
jgi:hypothetical protein